MEENVAQMNQEALNFMCEGNEVQAKQIFHQCLDQVQQRKNASMPGSSRSVIFPSPIPLMGALGPEDEWTAYQTAGQGFELYRHVFAISSIGAHIWDASTFSLFAAMVSYNLAIMYHHEGLVEGEMSALASARTLYYTSMNAFNNSRVGNDIGIAKLGLALYNNLGFLHAQVNDQQGMAHCRQLITTALSRHTNFDPETESFFRHSGSMWEAHQQQQQGANSSVAA